MSEEKVRLGGMALANGVLVHGPTSWACAIRTDDGRLEVAARRKRFSGAAIESPLLRGPARLLDAMALIPQIRKALPEARLPFQRPAVLAAMLGGAVVVKLVRDSTNVGPAARELVGGLLSVAPAALALRGPDVAAYHGAEHISIGSYEHGEHAPREHERCGSHLLGPLLATTALANTLASRAPVHIRTPVRLGAQLVARAALLRDGRFPRVVMQVFQKNHSFLGGMDEALAILKLCSHDWDSLTVHALYDGDRIEPWESVMTIEGDYTLFACWKPPTASRSSSCRRATTTIASRRATAMPPTSPAALSARRSA